MKRGASKVFRSVLPLVSDAAGRNAFAAMARVPVARFPDGLPMRALDPVSSILEHERSRWFLWAPVVFGGGAGTYFSLQFEPSLWQTGFVVALALAVWRLTARGRSVLQVFGLLMLLLALGFAAAKLRTEAVRAPVIAAPTDEVEAIGWIEGIEPRAKKGSRVTLRINDIKGFASQESPTRIRVSVKHDIDHLKVGDAVSAWVKLLPPAAPAAPGDYDFARMAWFKGLGGVGYATRPIAPQPIENAQVPRDIAVRAAIARVRETIASRIADVLPGEAGAIATALITGARGGISEDTNDAYRAAGLYHVLSISGLHMAIMGGAVFFTLRFLLALTPSLALRFDIKKWSAVGALIGAFFYLSISGGAFATLRSFVMIAVMFVAILLSRPAIALRNVAVAAILILIVFPESILDPGFQMSFAAVVALVAGYGAYERWQRARMRDRGRMAGIVAQPMQMLTGIVISTMFASLAVSPLALYHFHHSQHYAVLANALAMPVCNLVVMPMALATLVAMPFGGETAPLWLMGWGIDMMSEIARWVAALPGATGSYPAFETYAVLMMAGGGLWLALVGHEVRWAGAVVAMGGAIAATQVDRPDIWVSGDGNLVAVRQPDGSLAFSGRRASSYVKDRWLERDGAGMPAGAIRNDLGFRCDGLGCVTSRHGQRIVITHHPRARMNDCPLADVWIDLTAVAGQETGAAARATCSGFETGEKPLHITRAALSRHGTHLIYIEQPVGSSQPPPDTRAATESEPVTPPPATTPPVTPPPATTPPITPPPATTPPITPPPAVTRLAVTPPVMTRAAKTLSPTTVGPSPRAELARGHSTPPRPPPDTDSQTRASQTPQTTVRLRLETVNGQRGPRPWVN